jgi:hypothetical protein
MGDILDQLSRRGASICKHVIPHGEKCNACNILLYDSDETIKDASFADLLIASPRKKHAVDRSELQHRIRQIREQLRTPMVYQKDYIEASIAKSMNSRSRVITHKSNTILAREKLFPKILPVKADPPPKSEDSPQESTGIIDLTLCHSPSRMRLRVLLPPYGLEVSPMIIDVDDSVSGRALIARLMSEEHLGLDSSRSYVLRWVEDEDEMLPDLDLPPIDPDQPLTSINTNVLCLCDTEYGSESDDS